MTGSGKLLATTGPGGTLEIIECPTGRRIALMADKRGSFIQAEFLGRDGTLLGIVDSSQGQDAAWSASVWDPATARELYQLPRYQSNVTALATHPNSSRFAVGAGPTIEVYDLPTGNRLAQFGDHSKNITQLAFSPDGTLLASVCQDETAKIWDWTHKTELHRLIGSYSTLVHCIAFSPDGRTVVTGEHGGVRFWNTKSGQEMIQLSIPGNAKRLQFSADGKRLACWISKAPRDEWRVWSIER
jgi:WD40 repeat protein